VVEVQLTKVAWTIAILKLNCFVHDNDTGTVFPVKIASKESVAPSRRPSRKRRRLPLNTLMQTPSTCGMLPSHSTPNLRRM
jgi:hypothetical protein